MSWTINGVDISSMFGVYLKRGANDSFFALPTEKQYLTEVVREFEGENVYIYNSKAEARDIQLQAYIVGDSMTDLWKKRDAFVSFLNLAGICEFKLVNYNRIYRLYYKTCTSASRKSYLKANKVITEITIVFREVNPANVMYDDNIITERGIDITDQQGNVLVGQVNY